MSVGQIPRTCLRSFHGTPRSHKAGQLEIHTFNLRARHINEPNVSPAAFVAGTTAVTIAAILLQKSIKRKAASRHTKR